MQEAIQYIIIAVCLNCGNASPSTDELDYIRFYSDSLEIVGTNWKITDSDKIVSFGDVLYRGIFELKHDTTTAYLEVRGKRAFFRIPDSNINIALFQIQHETRYYRKEDL